MKANDIIHAEMKDKIRKEYYKRVRQLISSKLNGRNPIRAINSGLLKLTKGELIVMGRKTQKVMRECTNHKVTVID